MLARLLTTAFITYASYGCQSQPKDTPALSRPAASVQQTSPATLETKATTQPTTTSAPTTQPATRHIASQYDNIPVMVPRFPQEVWTTLQPVATTQPARLEELADTSYKIADLKQDYDVARTSNAEFPLQTKALVLWGNAYVSTANTERKEDERANLLITIDKSSIRHKKGQPSTIAPEEIYTLKRLRNEKGQPATKIWLNHEGPCGKIATRKRYETACAEARVIEITESDFEFNIGKVCIDGEWNYAPRYNDAFILGSDKTTTIEIAPDGRIALINEKDGFYYPQQNSAQDFRARTKRRLAKEATDKATEDARIEENNKKEKEKRDKSPGEVAKIE